MPRPRPSLLPGSWAAAPALEPPSLTWYLSWATLLPSSSEAEKLRYLVDSSWLGREEAWGGGLKFPGGLPSSSAGALAVPDEACG